MNSYNYDPNKKYAKTPSRIQMILFLILMLAGIVTFMLLLTGVQIKL